MTIQILQYNDHYNNSKGTDQEYCPECELIGQHIASSSQTHNYFNDLIMHTKVDIRQVNVTFDKGVTGK